jgi:O-antigen/teichoic acid export membrane protein
MAERDPYQSKHVRRGMRQFISGRLIQAVASVAVMLIMVRTMTVGEYALYITATALATFLGGVSIMGLDRVMTRYVPEGRIQATPEQLIHFIKKMNGLRLIAVGGLALVVALVWPYLAPWVHLPAQGLTLPVLLFAVVHAFVQFQSIVMQSLMLQEGLRNATTTTWLFRIGLLLGAVFAMPPLDAELAVWIILVSEMVGWLWMVYATANNYRELRRGHQNKELRNKSWPGDAREILKFGWHNYIMGQAAFPAQARVQQLVVAAFFPPPVVAGFGFFRNLSEQVRNYLPFQLMKNLAEPVIIGRYVQTKDFSQLNAMTSAMLKLNILLIAPLAAWLVVAGEPAIAFLTGGKFENLTWLLGVLVVSQIFSSQVTLLVIVSNAIGLSYRLPVATITASICTVLLLWTQIPILGIGAIALTDLLFSLVTVFMVVRSMRREGYRYTFGIIKLARMVGLAILVAIIIELAQVLLLDQRNALTAVISGFVMTALYWWFNIIWKPLDVQEQALLQRISGRVRIPF